MGDWRRIYCFFTCISRSLQHDSWIEIVSPFSTLANPQRYHEALDNLTPADAYFGRVEECNRDEKGSNGKDCGKDACRTCSWPVYNVNWVGKSPLLIAAFVPNALTTYITGSDTTHWLH